jgi:hypothetical protein
VTIQDRRKYLLENLSTKRLLCLYRDALRSYNASYYGRGLYSPEELKEELDRREHVATTKEEKKAERRQRVKGPLPFDLRKKYCVMCARKIKSRSLRKRILKRGLEFCTKTCAKEYVNIRDALEGMKLLSEIKL